jgi:hypothetical protein
MTDTLATRSKYNEFIEMTTWRGMRRPWGAAKTLLTGRACLDCGYIAMFATDPSDLE